MVKIYVTRSITDNKILPTTTLPDSAISSEVSIRGSPGEYIPATFTVYADSEIYGLLPTASHLSGTSLILSSNVDIRVVKCWYQAGERIDEPEHNKAAKVLTPELLLKDDSLVKVEDGENYVKLTTGEYKWISEVRDVGGRTINTIDELPIQDAATLQPVNIANGTNKQFWVTIRVPNNAVPGVYTGTIELNTPVGSIGSIQLTLVVHPMVLLRSSLTQSIFYRGTLDGRYPNGTISPDFKSEQQFRAEMQNLFNHGITNPAMYSRDWGIGFDEPGADPPRKPELIDRMLAIRAEVGMDLQPIYLLGAVNPWYGLPFKIEDYEAALAFFQNHGITEVYFYGKDEALWSGGVPAQEAIDILTAQRPYWEQIRAIGGKMFVAGVRGGYYTDARSPGDFGFMGDILDLLICHGPPSLTEAARWHGIGHKIFCYGNPMAGEEKPAKYRRNYGLLLWQKDYDGAMDYAYQDVYGASIWNDFDHNTYRDHVYAYPTLDGVIDTIQWEGRREGATDVRYLTTLLNAIQTAKSRGISTSEAESYLANLKVSNLLVTDLDQVRREVTNHILHIQSQLTPQPPPIQSILETAVLAALIIAVAGTFIRREL